MFEERSWHFCAIAQPDPVVLTHNMNKSELKPNIVVTGPFFPEPVQVIVVVPMGAAVKLIGKGSRSGQVYEPVLTDEQLTLLIASPAREPFDGDARKFRLGIEAMRLGLAYAGKIGTHTIWGKHGFLVRNCVRPNFT